MRDRHGRILASALLVALAGCTSTTPSGSEATASVEPSDTPVASASPSEAAKGFPVERFAGLGDEPVSDELAAVLQDVLETSAGGDGLTAAVIAPQGTWNGATGLAAGDRPMVPDDQMAIGHITQTIVAAQVMQLVEEGRLGLDDPAADHVPPDLEFDTNGASIADLLGHRSGLPENFADERVWESILTRPRHAWTPEEVLATVGPERTPPGERWEFLGTNYVVLGMIVEHVTGRPLAEVLRSGVLDDERYERLIAQPDEHPTEPMAMPAGASARTFDKVGGALPSLARVTAEFAETNMASDALSLARWFQAFCAGEVVSPASLDEMTDFEERPEFGLGVWDRSLEYGSGALGLVGEAPEGYGTSALCFPDQGVVVVVLANAYENNVDATAGALWRATST